MVWPFTRKALDVEQKDATRGLWEMLVPQGAASNGISVAAETALRQSTVLACTRIITETVGQLPLHVNVRAADGSVERDRVSPLHRMLAKRPNDWTTAYGFKVHMQSDVLLHGNAYALIQRDGIKQPRYLRKLTARSVSVDEDVITGELTYRVTLNGGGNKDYGNRDVLHLKALHGLSVISQIREAIALALAQEAELTAIASKGQRPSGILIFQNGLTDEALSRTAAQMRAIGEQKGTAILDSGASYVPVQMSNIDAQFLEMRRHQIAEIARAFRVRLHMLQELEQVTHQNAEQLGRQFLQFTMLPHLVMWQQEIALKLMPDDGSKYTEFLTDDLARADLAARMEAFAKAVTTGILNRNEVRQMESRAPNRAGMTSCGP